MDYGIAGTSNANSSVQMSPGTFVLNVSLTKASIALNYSDAVASLASALQRSGYTQE